MKNHTGGAPDFDSQERALFFVRIPMVGGKPTKGPTLYGWNLPADKDNPNGYTNDKSAAAAWIKAGDNLGLALVPSAIVSLDLDDLPQAKRIFAELGLPLESWLEDPARAEIKSGKPGKGKLLFRVESEAPVSRKLEFGTGKGKKSIFEIRHGSRDGKTLQDVLPPSVHPDTGKPYELIGDLSRIPTVPPELLRVWREWPADLLKSFDPDHAPPPAATRPNSAKAAPGQRDVIAEFNHAHDLDEILLAAGYTRKGGRWIRPGSDSGIPGLVVFDGASGKMCYSHGADALNDGFAHDAFDVFRMLQCAGDWKTALGWNPDLTRENQRTYASGKTAAPDQVAETDQNLAWQAPVEIVSTLGPVEPFDAALLPEAFRGWISDVSARMNCPPDFAAAGAMVALSAVVGRKIGIHPKRRDSWLVVPNLWGAIIGPPSSLKSPTTEEATGPLKRLEIKAKDAHAEDMRSHATEVMLAKAARENAEATVKKLVKNGDRAAAREAAEAATQDLHPPARRRFLVNDCTVEKLGEILNQNPTGVLLLRDEMSGWIATMQREDRSADRAFYLEGWNGSGRYTWDRIGRGTVDVESVTLSVFGGIQPGKLVPIIKGAIQGTEQDDGFLQRFQLAVYPDSAKTFTYVDRYPDTAAKNRAFEVFSRISDWSPACDDGIPATRFTDAAQKVFIEWLTQLEADLRGDDLHPALESHFAKYRSLAPSLALLLHLADLAVLPSDAEDQALLVGEESMLRAAGWCDYLKTHAARIYGLATRSAAANAAALVKRIQRGQLADGFTAREIIRKGWAGLTEKSDVDDAIQELLDHRWIREKAVGTTERGGRPTATYLINPAATGHE